MTWSDEQGRLHSDVLATFGETITLVRIETADLNVSDGTLTGSRVSASITVEMGEETVFSRRGAKVGRRVFGVRLSDLESAFGEGVIPGVDGHAWEALVSDGVQARTYELRPSRFDPNRASSREWIELTGTRKL